MTTLPFHCLDGHSQQIKNKTTSTFKNIRSIMHNLCPQDVLCDRNQYEGQLGGKGVAGGEPGVHLILSSDSLPFVASMCVLQILLQAASTLTVTLLLSTFYDLGQFLHDDYFLREGYGHDNDPQRPCQFTHSGGPWFCCTCSHSSLQTSKMKLTTHPSVTVRC